MDGVFITERSTTSPYLLDRPQLRLALDAAFCHLLAMFLIAVYFNLMITTIYKQTNEFQGNQDFYVAGTKRSMGGFH